MVFKHVHFCISSLHLRGYPSKRFQHHDHVSKATRNTWMETCPRGPHVCLSLSIETHQAKTSQHPPGRSVHFFGKIFVQVEKEKAGILC